MFGWNGMASPPEVGPPSQRVGGRAKEENFVVHVDLPQVAQCHKELLHA